MASTLASWNDTATTQAIVDFAGTAAQAVAPEERTAVVPLTMTEGAGVVQP